MLVMSVSAVDVSRFARAITRGLAAFAAAGFAAHAAAQDTAPGRFTEVIFDDYAPLAGNSELVRRLLSPLAAAQLARSLVRAGKQLIEQPVNLPDEKFGVYIPSRRPPGGYALLVFVPPWRQAKLPEGWASVLDQFGAIFVSAAQSGNDASVLGRRVPLALLGAQNIVRRYPVNPERVFIAGFSGGSRVALRLALGYPDLFRGAILNAGSDPIADRDYPIPPRELFSRFQESARLLYVTGERDFYHLHEDTASLTSMRRWCVFGVEDQVMPLTGHAVADSGALSRALNTLLEADRSGSERGDRSDRLPACRSAIERELAAKFQQVEARITAGQRDAAQTLLKEIDDRFGGLAAPRSVDLARDFDQTPFEKK